MKKKRRNALVKIRAVGGFSISRKEIGMYFSQLTMFKLRKQLGGMNGKSSSRIATYFERAWQVKHMRKIQSERRDVARKFGLSISIHVKSS